MNRELKAAMDDLRKSSSRYSRHRSELNKDLLDKKRDEVRLIAGLCRQNWIMNECARMTDANYKEKWQIINKLTNTATNFQVQPIAEKQADGSVKFYFEDADVLRKMEQYHIKMGIRISAQLGTKLMSL